LKAGKAKQSALLENRLEKKREKRRAELKAKQDEESHKRQEELKAKGIHRPGGSVKSLLQHAEGLLDQSELSKAIDIAGREAELTRQLEAARDSGDQQTVATLTEAIASLEQNEQQNRESKIAATKERRRIAATHMLEAKKHPKNAEAKSKATLQIERSVLENAEVGMAPDQALKAFQGVMGKRHVAEAKDSLQTRETRAGLIISRVFDHHLEPSASMQAEIKALQEKVVAMTTDEAQQAHLRAQFATQILLQLLLPSTEAAAEA